MVVKRRNSIEGQWVPHRIEMLRSPAWSVLSLSARRVLNRIEIEHADHGGNDNGRLPVTYDDFECYGIHRHAIRAAIQETVALGFVEITERGRAGNAEFRSPHKFRLTYFHVGRAPPTNEWQRIKTVEEAQLARAARREAPQKTKVQWRKTPNLSGGNRHRKRQFHSAETATTRLSADSTTTSISRGEGVADRPAREGVADRPAVLCSDIGRSFWAGTRVGEGRRKNFGENFEKKRREPRASTSFLRGDHAPLESLDNIESEQTT
jgi:hypothetical protein